MIYILKNHNALILGFVEKQRNMSRCYKKFFA